MILVSLFISWLFGAVMTACMLADWKVYRPLRIIGALLWPLTIFGIVLYGSMMAIFGK